MGKVDEEEETLQAIAGIITIYNVDRTKIQTTVPYIQISSDYLICEKKKCLKTHSKRNPLISNC